MINDTKSMRTILWRFTSWNYYHTRLRMIFGWANNISFLFELAETRWSATRHTSPIILLHTLTSLDRARSNRCRTSDKIARPTMAIEQRIVISSSYLSLSHLCSLLLFYQVILLALGRHRSFSVGETEDASHGELIVYRSRRASECTIFHRYYHRQSSSCYSPIIDRENGLNLYLSPNHQTFLAVSKLAYFTRLRTVILHPLYLITSSEITSSYPSTILIHSFTISPSSRIVISSSYLSLSHRCSLLLICQAILHSWKTSHLIYSLPQSLTLEPLPHR